MSVVPKSCAEQAGDNLLPKVKFMATNDESQQIGTIEAIAVRTEKEGPMKVVPHAEVAVAGGIAGDLDCSPHRGVTFISAEQWDETTKELNVEIPWHTRRANVLVRGLNLSETFDCTFEIGDVRIQIEGETHPCGLMDKLQPGLKDALTPNVRAGVHGRVLKAGTFSPGDKIRVIPKAADVSV